MRGELSTLANAVDDKLTLSRSALVVASALASRSLRNASATTPTDLSVCFMVKYQVRTVNAVIIIARMTCISDDPGTALKVYCGHLSDSIRLFVSETDP